MDAPLSCGARRFDRVFWTGGDSAKAAAEKFALENGGVTIGDTPLGEAAARDTAGLLWDDARPIWEAASKKYAEGASGVVHAFINLEAASPGSIWAMTELPALVDNPSVTDVMFHFVRP